MGETEKPFACDVSGCSVRFVSEDRLTSHKKRHRVAALSLNVGSNVASKNVVEQTPTPTRFIDYIEESGLFQELQPELSTPELHSNAQHLNPFEADFRRASHGELIVPEALSSTNGTDDSLNTPCIPPVTADPIALRGMPTPFTALIRDVIDAPNILKVAKGSSVTTSSVTQQAPLKERSPPDDTSEHESRDESQKDSALPPVVEATVNCASEKEKTVDSDVPTAKLGCAKTSILQACPKSPKPTAVLMKSLQDTSVPDSGAMLAVPSSAPPVVASTFSLPVSLPPRVPSAPLQPVAVAPVPVAPAVTAVPPKTTFIASHAGSVIQISDNVQFLIVSQPPGASQIPMQVPCIAPPVVQQRTRTKLKEALSTRSRTTELSEVLTGSVIGGNSPSAKRSLLPGDADLCEGSKRKQENGIDDERRKKNRENNRYAAQRSREKKKRLVEITRRERDEYKRKYEDLQVKYKESLSDKAKMNRERIKALGEMAKALEENKELKYQLSLHSKCPVTLELKRKADFGEQGRKSQTVEVVAQATPVLARRSELSGSLTHISLLLTNRESSSVISK